MKKWKIAIIGAGYMAMEHAKAFASLESVEIVGVYSRTKSRAEELASMYNSETFESIDSMYQKTKADVAVVTVTELSMPEICFQCFQYPWVCFLEKPVGINLSIAESIFAKANEMKVRAYVALNRRSYSSTRQAVKEITDDESPRLISILDQQDMVAAREMGQPEIVVNNYMYANSIHLIDYFTLFGRGDVISVDSVSPWNPEHPGNVVSVIRFSSGDVGVYQAVWDGPGPWVVTVSNRKVRLEMRPLEKLGIQRRGERRLTEVEPDIIDSEFKPGLRYQAEQILNLLEGKQFALATLESATKSMKLCASIYGLLNLES